MNAEVDAVAGSPAMLARAVQTGASVMNLWMNLSREARSAVESQLRIANDKAETDARLNSITQRDERETEKHQLDMQATRRSMERGDEDIARRNLLDANKDARGWAEHVARMDNNYARKALLGLEARIKVADYRRRTSYAAAEDERDAAQHEARMTNFAASKAVIEDEGRINRADFDRRASDSAAEQTRRDDLNAARIAAVNQQAAGEAELLREKVGEVRDRREFRRRAQGLSEDLAQQAEADESVMQAAARFGAAVGSGDLSEENAEAAAQYFARLREDADVDPEAFVEEALRAGEVPTPDMATEGTVEAMAADATFRTIKHHLDSEGAPEEVTQPDSGEQIGEAIEAAVPDVEAATQSENLVDQVAPAAAPSAARAASTGPDASE
ncbi:hypothetical protein ACQP1G_20515 [Nocardia sp. CA-107356]|uniref:hypothetical protein n=1 Tax=Nocardia sp. CA-107356 TaxID=3239972 RepID=UPI003D93626F